MNFKFEEDLDNNLLLLTVSAGRRTKINQLRVRCDFKSAQRLVAENYTCLETHVLKECINPIQLLDNNHSDACSITWKFKLTPKEKPANSLPNRPKVKKASKASIKKGKDE